MSRIPLTPETHSQFTTQHQFQALTEAMTRVHRMNSGGECYKHHRVSASVKRVSTGVKGHQKSSNGYQGVPRGTNVYQRVQGSISVKK